MHMAGPGQRSMLTLGGVSFTAQQPTSPERVLAFAVRGARRTDRIRLQAGECLVTISPALPDRMGGSVPVHGDHRGGRRRSDRHGEAQGSFAAE